MMLVPAVSVALNLACYKASGSAHKLRSTVHQGLETPVEEQLGIECRKTTNLNAYYTGKIILNSKYLCSLDTLIL